VYQLEFPWVLAALPLPLLVWWLLPPYREESASVRLAFFGDVAHAAGLAPQGGAVILETNWLQKLLAPLCWTLIVVAVARPQFVEPPIQKVQPARDLLLTLDLSQSMDTRDFRDPQGELETRVAAVRQVVETFVGRRPGDRIGLVVFGDAPYPLAPFTRRCARWSSRCSPAWPVRARRSATRSVSGSRCSRRVMPRTR
jgi:Ca-activated chloride channel family protein